MEMFSKIVTRLEGHDKQGSALESALQKANEESAARIASLEKTVQSQADTVANLTTQLAEQMAANKDLQDKLEKGGDLEKSESGRAVLSRLTVLETAALESGKATALVQEMAAHVKELQEEVQGKAGLKEGLAALRSRLAKVELSFTQRIGPLVQDEGSENARKRWKAKKASLMMSAQLALTHKNNLKEQEAALLEARRKLEEQEAREAEQREEEEEEEARAARLERERLQKEALLKEMADMEEKMKASQAMALPSPTDGEP